jgi:ubiquinone/menaquinone biosynthesis C-methylase UbiE
MISATTSRQHFGKTYSGTAPENYERFFVPSIGAPLASDLIARARLRPGERVLDVACGTGIIARRAAEQVRPDGVVAGLDINPGMLAAARSLGPSDITIRWYESPAESMPLPDEAFDVVLCQMGLQFMADKPAALREMRRVLAPRGRVIVSVPTPTAFFNALDEGFARHMPAGAGFVRAVFSLNDTAEIEHLFRDENFRDVVVTTDRIALDLPSPGEFLWQYIHSTPLAAIVGSADENTIAALERDVVGGWQPWVKGGGLTYQQGVVVTTARK